MVLEIAEMIGCSYRYPIGVIADVLTVAQG